MSRLSPNQAATTKFPFVGEREPAPSIADWQLEITGLVAAPLRFSLAEFLRLPLVEKTWDTICVTGWTHFDHRWRGVELNGLLEQAGVLPEAHFIRFVAHSLRDHDTSLPLDYARAHVLLASEVDGQPLGREHGGPVRSVCAGRYFYKSVKWLKRIELLAADQLGYWERNSAYHNNADPWQEERYVPQTMPPEEFARRVQTRDFSGAFVIRDVQFAQLCGLDLTGANFPGAQIKGCDLNGLQLRHVNSSGANFTLTSFSGTDLSGANLQGCDLEGADLRGANLENADLRETSLTATKFAHHQRPANIRGARFLWRNIEVDGVDEVERGFLLAPENGAIVE